MSTNLSRESRYASVLWIEGAPHDLRELNEMYERWCDEGDPAKKSKYKKAYQEAILENSDYMENFFGAVFTPRENAVQVCHDHFNLPNFEEILKYI